MLPTVPHALDVLVPLSAAWSLALTRAAPRLAATASPRSAVRMLSLAAAATTVCAATGATVLVGVLLARVPWAVQQGHWSVGALPEPELAWWWALPLIAVLTALLAAAVHHVAVVLRQLWWADSLCRVLGEPGVRADERWTVVDSVEPDAYALPGLPRPRLRRARMSTPGDRAARRGRGLVVVSTTMLAALDPDQQRALLAHERSHLVHRHHAWIQLTEIATLLNPLLRGMPRLVRAAAERQADLDAAESVGDTTLTATAIAAASLARTRGPGRTPQRSERAPAATGGDVVRRVDYLLRPPTRAVGRRGTVLLAALVVGTLLTTVGTGYCAVARLEIARTATVALDTGPQELSLGVEPRDGILIHGPLTAMRP